MTPLWALRVHSFDSQVAVRSLEGQLLLLRTLAQQPNEIALTWRLSVDPASRDEAMRAELSLICSTPTSAEVQTTQTSEMANLASVVLAAAHSLSLDWKPAPETLPRRCRLLAPAESSDALPVKPDWAMLVDLFRHRGERIVFDLECRSVTQTHGNEQVVNPPFPSPVSSADPGVDFLSGLVVQSHGPTLELLATVYTPSPCDNLLLTTISNLVLGIPTTPVTRKNWERAVLRVHPEEAIRAWHSPYTKLQGRGLTPSPPSLSAGRDLSEVDGVVIGNAKVQGPDWDRATPFRLADEERLRHVYIIGKTGVGKTNLLKNIAQQDIERGAGVAVLSPHADLIEHLLNTVGDRHEEVTYLDFGHPTHLPVLNPLSMDMDNPQAFTANSARTIELFTKRTFNQFTGPVFVDSMRLAIDTVNALKPHTGGQPTLVAAVELIRSDKLQRWASRQLSEDRPDLEEEWERFFNMRSSEASETARWVTAKFSDLGANSALRAITSDFDPPSFSIRDVYKQGGILLVKLPETHMPSISSSILGSLLFSSIYREAQLVGSEEANPFYVHVDEFQRFVTGDLEELVAEARKFKLGLTFAHQNLRQLEAFSTFEGSTNSRLAEAIFSNVGTIVAMKTSGRDVAPIAQELSVPETMIRGLVRGQAVVRTTHEAEDVTCTVRVPLADTSSVVIPQRIEERMLRDGVWRLAEDQHRKVEQMLRDMRAHAVSKPPMRVEAQKPVEKGGTFLEEWAAKRKQTPEPRPNAKRTNDNLPRVGKVSDADLNGE